MLVFYLEFLFCLRVCVRLLGFMDWNLESHLFWLNQCDAHQLLFSKSQFHAEIIFDITTIVKMIDGFFNTFSVENWCETLVAKSRSFVKRRAYALTLNFPKKEHLSILCKIGFILVMHGLLSSKQTCTKQSKRLFEHRTNQTFFWAPNRWNLLKIRIFCHFSAHVH